MKRKIPTSVYSVNMFLPSIVDGSSGFDRRVDYGHLADYSGSHALPIDQGSCAGAACDGRRQHFYRLVDNLRRCPWLFDLVDDFVVFEGETALLELVNQMDGKRDFSKVPNLIYRQNGKITVNQPFYSENINQLTAPNYDGFPLDLYLSPEPVLPVQFSRGCYYKDCAFCALTLDHQNFRQSEPGQNGR